MPDPVEGFTCITENSKNVFVFVQGLAKGVIQFNKLINWWVPSSEARRKTGYNIIV